MVWKMLVEKLQDGCLVLGNLWYANGMILAGLVLGNLWYSNGMSLAISESPCC